MDPSKIRQKENYKHIFAQGFEKPILSLIVDSDTKGRVSKLLDQLKELCREVPLNFVKESDSIIQNIKQLVKNEKENIEIGELLLQYADVCVYEKTVYDIEDCDKIISGKLEYDRKNMSEILAFIDKLLNEADRTIGTKTLQLNETNKALDILRKQAGNLESSVKRLESKNKVLENKAYEFAEEIQGSEEELMATGNLYKEALEKIRKLERANSILENEKSQYIENVHAIEERYKQIVSEYQEDLEIAQDRTNDCAEVGRNLLEKNLELQNALKTCIE